MKKTSGLLLIFLFTIVISCSSDNNNNAPEPTPPNETTVTDIDGNIYNVIQIGTQTWMMENLKTSKYRNGDPINNVANNSWYTLSNGAWCYYDNDISNNAIHGKLYNWYAVNDSRNICPIGWHIPTDNEWIQLENYLIDNGYNYDGTINGNKIAKSMATKTLWNSSTVLGAIGNNLTLNNNSSFNAYPSGGRYNASVFGSFGSNANFWSATEYDSAEAWYRGLSWAASTCGRSKNQKYSGFSVRCIKD